MNHAAVNQLKELAVQLERTRRSVTKFIETLVLDSSLPPPRCDPLPSDDTWPGPAMIRFEVGCIDGIRSFPATGFTTEQLHGWLEKHRPHLLPESHKKARALLATKLCRLADRGLITRAVKSGHSITWRRVDAVEEAAKKITPSARYAAFREKIEPELKKEDLNLAH